MADTLIEFKLSSDGKPLILLTEHTIQSMDLIAAKTRDHIRQTKDVSLQLLFENADVAFREPPSDSDSTWDEEDTESKPDELDSIRNLLIYAVSSNKRKGAYLDGEIMIRDEKGQNLNFSYKNLFVLSCSEAYSESMRSTSIHIQLREKAR